MRKSTHYQLNLPEGTDIVNPLIVDVPNMETIDEVLFENANASISNATELLGGSVHALTRENPNSAVFRFTATSNFTAGETFTVDGVQVTALLPTGQTLGTGSYVIGANVICCLVGTNLTVFTTQGGDITSADSDRLGGEEPSYYATAQSVVEAVNLAQAANNISLNNQTALGSINGQLNGLSFVALTQTEYDSLVNKDSNTVYLIKGE